MSENGSLFIVVYGHDAHIIHWQRGNEKWQSEKKLKEMNFPQMPASFLGSEDIFGYQEVFLYCGNPSLSRFFSPEARAEKKSASSCLAKRPAIDEATKGIMDRWKKWVWSAPLEVHSEMLVATRGRRRVGQEFASEKMDLIFTLGTSATIALPGKSRTFDRIGAVYDPVKGGIAKDWKSSAITQPASAQKFPISKIMDVLREFKTWSSSSAYSPAKRFRSPTKRSPGDSARLQNQGCSVPLSRKEDVALILPMSHAQPTHYT